jgi:hypothetical protein
MLVELSPYERAYRSAHNIPLTAIEVVERRTRTSKTFLLVNGYLRTILHGKPIHYRHDGQWKDINPTYYGETGGVEIRGAATTYLTARATSTNCFPSGWDEGLQAVGQYLAGGWYYVYRSYFSFDTSPIPDGDIVTAATLYICAHADYSTTTDFLVQVYRYAWAEPLCNNQEANYDGAYGAQATLEGTLRNTADGWVSGTYYSLAVDTAGINKEGDTKYTLVSNRDVNANAPSGSEYVAIRSVDYAGTASDPYLDITHAPAVQPAYKYNKKITIDHTKVGADLTNYPFLFNTTDVKLRTVANGGHVEHTASGGASGSLTVPADLVFSPNLDGSQPYDFEVEEYDPATGKLVAHVRIPSLDADADTILYVVYGDSTITTSQENVPGTWDTFYTGVWHLGESSGLRYDSKQANHLSDVGSVGNAPGQIGVAASFDGTNKYLTSSSAALRVGDLDFCLFVWMYLNTKSAMQTAVGNYAGNSDYWFNMEYSFAADRFRFWYNKTGYSTQVVVANNFGSPSVSTWYFIACWFVAATDTLYISVNNGTPNSVAAAYPPLTGGNFYVGVAGPDNQKLNGRADEVRFAKNIPSSGRITTTYNNQANPGTFYALGGEVSLLAKPYSFIM